MRNIQPTMQSGYPIPPATQKQAQSETNLQKFKTKLDSLIKSYTFNKKGKEINNEYLVDELRGIYFMHCTTDNKPLDTKPLNKQLSTLIDNWINANSIETTRIGTGEAITRLLNKAYDDKQTAKKAYDDKQTAKNELAAIKATATKPPTPIKPAPPKKEAPTKKAAPPKKPAAQGTLKLHDMHALLAAIYLYEVSKSQQELNEEPFYDCDNFLPHDCEALENVSKSQQELTEESYFDCDNFLNHDCEALENKSGQLLPEPVLDAILRYCCFNNDDLKPDALISFLDYLHTKFNGIPSKDNKLSMYESELIRFLKEIQNIFTTNPVKQTQEYRTAHSKLKRSPKEAIDTLYSLLPEDKPMHEHLKTLLEYLGKQKLSTNKSTAHRILAQQLDPRT
jgi:hypothetical protein